VANGWKLPALPRACLIETCTPPEAICLSMLASETPRPPISVVMRALIHQLSPW
jgi:hypothetical protein